MYFFAEIANLNQFILETAAVGSAIDNTGKLIAAISTLVKNSACAALIQIVGPFLAGATNVIATVKGLAISLTGVAATILSAIVSLLNLVLMLVACILDFVVPLLLASPALAAKLCNTTSGLVIGITQIVLIVSAALQAIAGLVVSEI